MNYVEASKRKNDCSSILHQLLFSFIGLNKRIVNQNNLDFYNPLTNPI